MAKAICKRRCSSFYLPKYPFNSIPISMRQYLKSVAIFSQNGTKVIGVIDEKQSVVELIATI